MNGEICFRSCYFQTFAKEIQKSKMKTSSQKNNYGQIIPPFLRTSKFRDEDIW